MPSRTASVVYLCGHVIRAEEPVPTGGFFGTLKRLFTSPPPKSEVIKQPCPACQTGLNHSLVPNKPRTPIFTGHAPPPLGHEETIAAVALGGSISAVEKLKKIQSDNRKVVAKQQKKKKGLVKAPPVESQVAKQLQAQLDLEKAAKFWKNYHQQHSIKNAAKNSESCAQCSEMAEILSNPNYRSKTSFNDKMFGFGSEIITEQGVKQSLSSYNSQQVDGSEDTQDDEYEAEDEGEPRGKLETISGHLRRSRHAEELEQEYTYGPYVDEEVVLGLDSLSLGYKLTRCSRDPNPTEPPSPPPSLDDFPDNEESFEGADLGVRVVDMEELPQQVEQKMPNQTLHKSGSSDTLVYQPAITLSAEKEPGAELVKAFKKYFSMPEDMPASEVPDFLARYPSITGNNGPYYRTPKKWGVSDEGHNRVHALRASHHWLDARNEMIKTSALISWPEKQAPPPPPPSRSSSKESNTPYYSNSDEEKSAEEQAKEAEFTQYVSEVLATYPDMGSAERDAMMLAHAKNLYGTSSPSPSPSRSPSPASIPLPPSPRAEMSQEDIFKAQEMAFDEEFDNVVSEPPRPPMPYLTTVKNPASHADGSHKHTPEKGSSLRKEVVVLER